MIDCIKLAEEIMNELVNYFDGYYINDGGYEQLREDVCEIIEKHLGERT